MLALLRKIDQTARFVERWIIYISIPIMIIMGAMQIITRFVIHKPIPWSEGLLTFLFMWTSYVGASLAVATQSHFQVDLFTSFLPPSMQRSVDRIGSLFVIAFALFLSWQGWALLVKSQSQIIGLLGISVSWGFLCLVFSGTCMVIHSVVHIAATFDDSPYPAAQ